MHQGELAGSCLLTYLTVRRKVDGMLGPGEPKDGKGVSTAKGHLYPCPTLALCQHSSPIFSALLVPLTKLSPTRYGFFHFIAEIFSVQTHPYVPSLCSLQPYLSNSCWYLRVRPASYHCSVHCHITAIWLRPGQPSVTHVRAILSGHLWSLTCHSSPHRRDADRYNGNSPCGAKTHPG